MRSLVAALPFVAAVLAVGFGHPGGYEFEMLFLGLVATAVIAMFG